MNINQAAIKKLCHAKGKNISKGALQEMNAEITILVYKCIDSSNGHKTILRRDVANFSIKTNLGG